MSKKATVTTLIVTLFLSLSLQAQDGKYTSITDDLGRGMDLQELSDRAFDNADDYWEQVRGTERDGDDEELSAGEAVTAIYTQAGKTASANTRDIVSVTVSVVDSWNDCEDTFDAVRTAVSLEPARADEIIAAIANKRDCNCSNGGLWLDQRVDERIRVEQRHAILDVPIQCSCSQIAMYAGIAGLPENREFDPDMPDAEKAIITARMTEQVQVISDRVSAGQSLNGWECGCTDINIAASMQGIAQDELRDGTYDGLAEKYTQDAGDQGLVVDSFGVVGNNPEEYWGDDSHVSANNVLRRDPEVYRGDNLLMDDFHPATEFTAHGDGAHEHVGQHVHTSGNIPTDLIISEYVEGWNEEALQTPIDDRDPEQRNRVLELYNGSENTIDLGKGQYFLEIYGADGEEGDTSPRQVIGLNGAIEAGDTWVVAFDQSDDNLKDAAHEVTGQLDFQANDTLVVRRMGGDAALYCRVQATEFVLNYPPIPFIRVPDPMPTIPPGPHDMASPN